MLPLNDEIKLESALKQGDVAAVIVEGIQGIGGCRVPEPAFLKAASQLCEKYGVVLILDEIQSGYGRSGKFFAHQYADIKPDIISVAKGMGNGFPVGGILISPKLKPWFGMLGTTFGGNYLACAAGIAVLDIMKAEKLVDNAFEVGNYMFSKLAQIHEIKELRGKGLMIGVEFDFPVAPIRKQLLFEEKIFTGVSGTNTIRILPPLTLTKIQVDLFINSLVKVLNKS
jgi:acetylornithine aminotransferase